MEEGSDDNMVMEGVDCTDPSALNSDSDAGNNTPAAPNEAAAVSETPPTPPPDPQPKTSKGQKRQEDKPKAASKKSRKRKADVVNGAVSSETDGTEASPPKKPGKKKAETKAKGKKAGRAKSPRLVLKEKEEVMENGDAEMHKGETKDSAQNGCDGDEGPKEDSDHKEESSAREETPGDKPKHTEPPPERDAEAEEESDSSNSSMSSSEGKANGTPLAKLESMTAGSASLDQPTGLIGVPQVGRMEDLVKNDEEEDENDNGDRPHQCSECSYKARKKGQLRKHMAVHRVFLCAHCEFTSRAREELQTHMKANHPNRCGRKLCKKCNVLFSSTDLEEHEQNCTGEKKGWACSQCDKEFKFLCALKSHEQRWHSGGEEVGKMRQCKQCDFKAALQRDINQHINSVHREKPKEVAPKLLKCPECDAVFEQETDVRNHVKESHITERPFVCELCQKAFKTKTHLKNHYETHNPSDTYKCEVEGCTTTFKAAKYYERHRVEVHKLPQRRHKASFPCPHPGCDEVFPRKSLLLQHEVSHTGVQTFCCDWPDCGKVYGHHENLQKHYRTHTHEKPFKCSLCENAYNQRSGLKYHMLKAHGVDMSQKSAKNKENKEVESSAKSSEEKADNTETSNSNDSSNKDVYDFNDSDDDDIDLKIRQLSPAKSSPRKAEEPSSTPEKDRIEDKVEKSPEKPKGKNKKKKGKAKEEKEEVGTVEEIEKTPKKKGKGKKAKVDEESKVKEPGKRGRKKRGKVEGVEEETEKKTKGKKKEKKGVKPAKGKRKKKASEDQSVPEESDAKEEKQEEEKSEDETGAVGNMEDVEEKESELVDGKAPEEAQEEEEEAEEAAEMMEEDAPEPNRPSDDPGDENKDVPAPEEQAPSPAPAQSPAPSSSSAQSDPNDRCQANFASEVYEMPGAPRPPPVPSDEEDCEEMLPEESMPSQQPSEEVSHVAHQSYEPSLRGDSSAEMANPPSSAPVSNEVPQTPSERPSVDYMQTPNSEPYSVPPPSYSERRSSFGTEIMSPLESSGKPPDSYPYPDSASYQAPGSYPSQVGLPPGSVEAPQASDVHLNSLPGANSENFPGSEPEAFQPPPSVSQPEQPQEFPSSSSLSTSSTAPYDYGSSSQEPTYLTSSTSRPPVPEASELPGRSHAVSAAAFGDAFPSSRDFLGQYFQDPSTLPLSHQPMGQDQRASLPSYQQQGLSALQRSNADFLRRSLMPGGTYPSVTESFMGMPPSALPQPAQQSPWPGMDERPRHWPNLMPPDNPYPNDYAAFDGAAAAKRPESAFPVSMGQTSSSSTSYDLTSWGSRGFQAPTASNYPATRAPQKPFDDMYRHHISDYRPLPQPMAAADMYSRMAAGLDKYYYPREAVYRSQPSLPSAPPFMPPSSSAQMPTYAERDYVRNPVYPSAHGAYGFMAEKQYLGSSNKVPQPAMPSAPTAVPGAEYLQAPTAAPQDPYRTPLMYNMVPRYF